MCNNIPYIDSANDTILLAPELLQSIPSRINKIKSTTNSHPSSKLPLHITNRQISLIDSEHVTKETKDIRKVENKCIDEKNNYCSICTERISVYAVSQCNHRICYICALRSRVLFKTSTCPYCRAQQHKMIFTRDSDKSFSTLLSSKAWYIFPDFQILCEDEQIFRMVTNIVRLQCPLKSCQVACDGGWVELFQHVRTAHKLMFCGICVEYRKIFSWEHQLFTREELKRHCRNGDGKDSNFRGHPSCIECNVTLYDLIEFREHYLMHHSSVPLVLNSSRSSNSYHNSQTLLATRHSSTSRASLSPSSQINNAESEKNTPFIINLILYLVLALLRTFTFPSSSNKFFASIVHILDTYISPLFTSIFHLNLDENSQLESALHSIHSIFISIYSIGIRIVFVIAYLTMVFWVLKSWMILMSWIVYSFLFLFVFRICWMNWIKYLV